MNWYYDFLTEVQNAVMALLIKLGVFVIPLMPASFLAYAVYGFFRGDVGLWFGVISGLVLVIIGVVTSEIALKTIDAWQAKNAAGWKAVAMCTILPVSTVTAAIVIFFSDGTFPAVIRALGIAGEFMAMFVYIALAISRSIDTRKSEKLAEKLERRGGNSGGKRVEQSGKFHSGAGNSTGKPELIPVGAVENSSVIVEPLETIMEKYGVQKSRAYEIRAAQRSGTWNGGGK